VAGLIAQGARAAWLLPKSCEVAMLPGVIGALCAALERHSLPLFLDRREISTAELTQLCAGWPGLPIVLSGGWHRFERWIFTLMEIHPNLYLGTVPPAYTHRGIEHVVQRCGPGRLLFATHHPLCDPAGAIACLSYAEIEADAKDGIGHGNLERLTRCVH
jgi:predicted TIM-barrel fold metal-dependent hydrolase